MTDEKNVCEKEEKKSKLQNFIDGLWKYKYLFFVGILAILYIFKKSGLEGVSKNIGDWFHIAGTIALVLGFLIYINKRGTKGLSNIFGNFKLFSKKEKPNE